VNRMDFQRLSRARLREARKLLRGGEPSGSYYLSGYAIECGLKSCIASHVRKSEFPVKQTVLDSYNHDLEKLVGTAGLTVPLQQARKADSRFHANWMVVKDWRVDSRYEMRTKKQAGDMIKAIDDPNHGVMQWIMRYW
jgi:hypothetical protein